MSCGILWPLVPADLARTSAGTSYVLRVNVNGTTENLTTPTMTAGRLYWMSDDGQADADGGVGGVGDLIAILQATLETHSLLTGLNTTVNLSDENIITVAVDGLDFQLLWSHASTTLSALPWGFAQQDYDATQDGSLYRQLAPNQTYGAFLPQRPVSFDSREKSAFRVRAAKSISDLQRTSRIAVGKPTRDLRLDLLEQAWALKEFTPATRPTGTAEDVYLYAASTGRPVRYYPDASSRTSGSYQGPYCFRAEERLDSREDLIVVDREPRFLRYSFRLPLRSFAASASGVNFSGIISGGSSGAPTDAQYLTLATHAGLTSERVATPGHGILGADGGAGAAYTLSAPWRPTIFRPPFVNYNSNSASLSPAVGECYALYLGRADRAITGLSVQWRHITNLTGTIAWAEFALATGAPTLGSGVTLTQRGYVDVSGPISAGAPANHTSAITVSGVAKGDDLWLLFGVSTSGSGGAILGATVADVIGAGFYQRATARPSAVSATSFAVETSTSINTPSVGLQVTAP